MLFLKLKMYKDKIPSVKAVAVLYFKDQQVSADLLGGAVKKVADHFGFRGEKGELYRYPLSNDTRELLLVGMGEKCNGVYRDSVAEIVRDAGKFGISSIALILPCDMDSEVSSSVAEGVVLGGYSFKGMKLPEKDDRSVNVESVFVCGACEDDLNRGALLGEAQCYSRDLANRPGNDINPLTFAEEASKVAAEGKLNCSIWDENKIQEEGMSALWHVGKGSDTPPRFIHMIYRPEGNLPSKRVAIVGKGVTFDSGGLCIKTRTGIKTMKCDKTGACNVLAIMRAVAKLKPNVEVHGIMGMVENMPDGSSYRPDDIVKARNGKSIEIANTDAEGRVTLADTLSYASELEVDAIIDMATLTGAAITALGNYTAGLISDDDELSNAIQTAGKKAGERYHRFTMDDVKLRKQIDSPVADVINSGGPGGGMITAGMFLREFVNPSIPWVHLDIAAVDFYDREFDCYGKGATSFGTRTCLEYLLNS